MEQGLVATCSVIDLEVLYGAIYEADYDLIASVTGQPVDWVVSRGSL